MYPDNMTPSKAQSWYKDSLWSHNMEYVAFKAVEFIEDNQNEDWFLYMVSHPLHTFCFNPSTTCIVSALITTTIYICLESNCSTQSRCQFGIE